MKLRSLFLGLLLAALAASVGSQHAAAQGCPAGSVGVTFQTNETGAACDVPRNKFDTGALLTLASATSASATVNHQSFNGRGLKCTIGDLVVTGGGFFQLTVQGYDPASANYYPLITSRALTGVESNGSVILTVYPGIPSVPGISVNDVMPRWWRLLPLVGGGATVTGTVGCVDLL